MINEELSSALLILSVKEYDEPNGGTALRAPLRVDQRHMKLTGKGD